jgi:serine/threonine protein kinase HipA of HipAB toxin-antitoxin module
MGIAAAPKFTLRFRNSRTHEILGLLAERFGISKNQLAEEMLERELQAAALLLERDLTGTIELLRRYRKDEHLQGAIAEVAQAEADQDDPLPTKMVSSARTVDAYGVADAFA